MPPSEVARLTAQALLEKHMPNRYPKDLATTLCWRGLLLCTTRFGKPQLMHDQVLDQLPSKSPRPMPLGLCVPTGLAAHCSGSKGWRACTAVSASQLQDSQAPQPHLTATGAASCRGYLATAVHQLQDLHAHQISCMIRS